jgi:hypothetical protein
LIADYFGNKRVPTPIGGQKPLNPYAAGHRSYGSGRPMPNIGPVAHPQGYEERDNRAQARKNAILRRLKTQASGNPSGAGLVNYISRGAF